ncbi:MAG: glycosyltransferase family 2 protein [Saprospiraceae bacterium]
MISILMPVYNTEKYLPTCLDSILNQNEKNWELLAVNDFSTDNSKQILEEYAAKDERIKVFDNIEKGIIPALRLAYAKSSGEFITRMDSDDLMKKHKLKSLKRIVEKYDDGTVATAKVKYFTDEGELGEGYKKYEQWLNQLDIDRYTEIYKECVIPSPCWMTRRADLDKVGAFDADRYPEDYDLCFRFYENEIIPEMHNEVLHLWRDRPDRISRTGAHYADNAFLDLKLHYFLEIEHFDSKTTYVWGAGKKGKAVARKLIEKGVEFTWVTDNIRKRMVDIYGKRLQPPRVISRHNYNEAQGIILVANPVELEEIWDTLDGYENTSDNFVSFC